MHENTGLLTQIIDLGWLELFNELASIDADWSDPYIALSRVMCLSSDVAPSATATTDTFIRELSCPE